MIQTAGLHLEKLLIRLGDRTIASVDARVPPGAVLSVMGPSGVGKSTLLAAIAGTLDPAFSLQGRVWLDGTDVTDRQIEKRRIGLLFQDELLFQHLSVGGNLAFGLTDRVKGRVARRAAVETALEEVGLAGFSERAPTTLSGGQKARVALMRMMLSEPKALLLDEAFSRLDADRRSQIRDLVFGVARARGLPVLQVTHDPVDADAAGGEIIRLTMTE